MSPTPTDKPHSLLLPSASEDKTMQIHDAQRDVRITFLAGFPGQLVSALVWLASAALATWSTPKSAILALVLGGMLIFPLTQLTLRLLGRPASLPQGHPMNALAVQIAFIVPLLLPLIAAATLHHLFWFYPAFLLVVGVHYLPFTYLYGMRLFLVLAALMIAAGLLIGLYVPTPFALGGWIGAALLLTFALLGLRTAAAEKPSSPPEPSL
jgi:hypothetical protein